MTRGEQIEKAAVENGCGFYDNGYARFAEGAAWADEHPHWISVEDELPPKKTDEVSDKVLVYDAKTNRVYTSWYFHSIERWVNGWDNITHWMPLPTPPEKGGEQ